MAQTAMGEKLKSAGYPVERDQMYLAAAEALRHCKGDVEAAMRYFRGFIELVRKDMGFGSNADGGQDDCAREGHTPIAADSSRGEGQYRDADEARLGLGTEFGSGEGQNLSANEARVHLPPAPETLTDAARVLRKAPGSGAGALRPTAYEYRAQIRGESWLLTYCDPTGNRMLARTFGENEAIARRLIREGGERLTAGAIAAALGMEGEKLGRVSPDQVIEKTLPPAALDRVARLMAPERISSMARKVAREFTQKHAALMEGANG